MAQSDAWNASCMVIYRDFLTNSELDLFIIILIIAICSPIGLFGLLANCINMVVFYKQGFTDCVNISLFTLAISDIGGLLTLLYVNVCLAPWLQTADIDIKPRDISLLTGAFPHICFARITSWISIFVSCERCVCITLPFKVKAIFVPKMVVSFLVGIFVTSALGVVPAYFAFTLKWEFDPFKNRSIFQQIVEPNQSLLLGTTYLHIFIQVVSFVTITLLTAILIIKLKQSTKWRTTAASTNQQSSGVSNREKRTIRMVIFITCILIVCYIPSTLCQLIWLFEPEFSTGGAYNNLQMACWLAGFFTEGVNSSVTGFVYYNMSSTYREIFNVILGIKNDTNKYTRVSIKKKLAVDIR